MGKHQSAEPIGGQLMYSSERGIGSPQEPMSPASWLSVAVLRQEQHHCFPFLLMLAHFVKENRAAQFAERILVAALP